jgi:hypothetical protein
MVWLADEWMGYRKNKCFNGFMERWVIWWMDVRFDRWLTELLNWVIYNISYIICRYVYALYPHHISYGLLGIDIRLKIDFMQIPCWSFTFYKKGIQQQICIFVGDLLPYLYHMSLQTHHSCVRHAVSDCGRLKCTRERCPLMSSGLGLYKI